MQLKQILALVGLLLFMLLDLTSRYFNLNIPYARPAELIINLALLVFIGKWIMQSGQK